MPPTDITKVPGLAIARLIVPSASADGHAPRQQVNGQDTVADCRGETVVSDWTDSNGKHRPGAIVTGARQNLPDGRQAVWLYTSMSLGAPATRWFGFLAIVHLDGANLVADGVGAWSNGEDAPRKLDPAVFGPDTFVESQGHTGTGGGSDSTGRGVWLLDRAKGLLTFAGSFDVQGFEQYLGPDDGQPHWEYSFSSTVKPGPQVHVIDHVTWTLRDNDRATRVVDVDHIYVIEHGKLRDTTGHKIVPPPLPATAASPAPASPAATQHG